jgi:hypothetical protein
MSAPCGDTFQDFSRLAYIPEHHLCRRAGIKFPQNRLCGVPIPLGITKIANKPGTPLGQILQSKEHPPENSVKGI